MPRATRRGVLAALAAAASGLAGCRGSRPDGAAVEVTPATVPTDAPATRHGDPAPVLDGAIPGVVDPRPVTDRHADAAVAHARRLIARAGDLHEEWPAGEGDSSGSTLRSTVDAIVVDGRRALAGAHPSTAATLELAAEHVRRGGYAVGVAGAAAGRLDDPGVPALSTARRRRADLEAGLRYACDDPEPFLVAVGAAERRLVRCRRETDGAPRVPVVARTPESDGTNAGWGASLPDDGVLRQAGRALAARAAADRACDDARRYLAAYRASAGERRPFEAALARNRRRIDRELVDREARLSRSDGLARRAWGTIVTYGAPAPDREAARRLAREGYPAAGLVHGARALVRLDGAVAALERPRSGGVSRTPSTATTPGAGEAGGAAALAAERAAALDRLRTALGASGDDPLVRLLLLDVRAVLVDVDEAVRETGNPQRAWQPAEPASGYRLAGGMATAARRAAVLATRR